MAFSTAYKDDLEIIDVNDPYFIGRTDQWQDHPDSQICLGYNGEYNKLIIPVDCIQRLEDPEEYHIKDINCDKYTCISRGVLRSRGKDELFSLNWCSNCHNTARKEWKKLILDNPELGVAGII